MSIEVNSKALRSSEDGVRKLSKKLGSIGSSLQSIRKSLDSDIKNSGNIDKYFKSICEEMHQNEGNLANVAEFLSDTAKTYEDAEKKIKKDLNGISNKKSSGNIISKILDKIRSIGEKVRAIFKILGWMKFITSPIGPIIILISVKKYFDEKGIAIDNEDIQEIEVKKVDIPELKEILSYDPGTYKEEVLMLQKRLNELEENDALKIKEDGFFGKETLAAVNRYKEKYGLWNFGEYEGKVGQTTWEHLFTNECNYKVSGQSKDEVKDYKVNDNQNITVKERYYDIGISFEQALQNEYNAKWYDRNTGKTVYACVKQSGKEWVRASIDEIRYYLDPNNFINDPIKKYQFLVLDNNPSIAITPDNEMYLIEEIDNILKGKGSLDGKGKAFVEAAKETGIALPYLVAHCILETGWGTSNLANGINKNGECVGYYNMFGIEAFDSDPLGNGLEAAKKYGWNSVEAAIIGGAKWISENYTSNPSKNTLYKMKWQPSDPLGLGQYATDIAWASKQCETIKKLYDLFPDAKLEFDIPAYSEANKTNIEPAKTTVVEGIYPRDSWKPCTPAVTNSVGERSAEAYKAVIDQFNVSSESNMRYKPYKNGKGDTYCNIFAWDVTSAMGAEIPHWVDSVTGEPRNYPDVKGAIELNANGMAKWLKEHGSKYGWIEVSAKEAQEAANSGKPAVVCWYNNYYKGADGTRVFDEINKWSRDQYPGHIAIVRPEEKTKYPDIISNKGVYIAQAGSNNYNYNKVESGFSEEKMNQTEYFKYYIHE